MSANKFDTWLAVQLKLVNGFLKPGFTANLTVDDIHSACLVINHGLQTIRLYLQNPTKHLHI